MCARKLGRIREAVKIMRDVSKINDWINCIYSSEKLKM